MPVLAARQEVAEEARPGVPPGHPLSVPRYKEKSGKDIFDPMHRPPFCYHARQAKGAKAFCLKFSLQRVRSSWQKFFAFALARDFRVCKLNKLANTEVARKQNSKRFFHPSPHPVQLNSKQNDFTLFACRSWWQNDERHFP